MQNQANLSGPKAVPDGVKVPHLKVPRVDGDVVQSLTRALGLLEILSEGGCRLKELSHRAGLPPSTTHRLLTTLEQKRFVSFDRDCSVWNVGSNCYAVGAGFLRRQDFIAEATPRIQALARQIGATVNLGIPNGKALLLIKQAAAQAESPAQPPGASLPLHATAMGKVILAASHDRRQVDTVLSMALGKMTERTICNPMQLGEELQSVRHRGFAIDNEESMMGRYCIAAPIRNEFGCGIAAISMTATPGQMTETAVGRLGVLLAATAAEITCASGGFNQKHLF